MSTYYLGTLSGTSIDSIDVALVEVTTEGKLRLCAQHQQPFSQALAENLQALCLPQTNEVYALGQASRQFAIETAQAVQTLLQSNHFTPKQITAIGSHGQTVRHHPNAYPSFSLQIGCPDTLAALTNIPVVSHFRQKDIALGGQGAPLAPAFHQAVFKTKSHALENVAVLNLGGIANITWLPSQGPILGFDTGPANTLLDRWYQAHAANLSLRNTPYDTAGQWAQSGQVCTPLLQTLLADPYFSLPPPKSTGREYFTLAWLQSYLTQFQQAHPKLAQPLQPQDIQATLVELTALSVLQAIEKHCPTHILYLCGGGVHNQYLINRLRYLAPSIQFESSQALGIEPDWVEAMLFAWLAYCHVNQLPIDLRTVTGARRPAILGRFTPV